MTLSFDPDIRALDARHYIGGAAVAGAPGVALYRPSDGAPLAHAPVAGAEIVDHAVETAQQALRTSGWATAPPRDRTRAMHRWADFLEADAPTLARLAAICSTRPVGQLPAGDIAVTAEQIRFFAEMADKEGDLVPTAAGALGMTVTGTVWDNCYGRSRDTSCRRAATGPRASGLGREAYHVNRRSKSVLIDIGREAA